MITVAVKKTIMQLPRAQRIDYLSKVVSKNTVSYMDDEVVYYFDILSQIRINKKGKALIVTVRHLFYYLGTNSFFFIVKTMADGTIAIFMDGNRECKFWQVADNGYLVDNEEQDFLDIEYYEDLKTFTTLEGSLESNFKMPLKNSCDYFIFNRDKNDEVDLMVFRLSESNQIIMSGRSNSRVGVRC